MTLELVDVSHHQGVVNWSLVKAAGVTGVMVKATEGLTYRDPRFTSNCDAAQAAGLRVGAYHFAHPTNDPVKEADAFLRAVEGHTLALPLVLDIETAGARLASWSAAFLAHVEVVSKSRPMLYTYVAFAHEFATSTVLGRYGLWLASYRPAMPAPPKPWSRIDLWQYTDKGHVAGIGGLVDRNVFNGDVAALDALRHANADPVPPSNYTGDSLLMAAALNDADARRCLIRQWFMEYLGRGFLTADEQAFHEIVFATKGADLCLAGITDSNEAVAYRKRTPDAR